MPTPVDQRYSSDSIGVRIAPLRKRRGLTQQELGRQIPKTGSNISQVEAGTVEWTPGQLAALAQVLDINALHLVTGVSSEVCEIVDVLEALNEGRRAAAIRVFRAALELVDAGSAWHGNSAP
jgi:transcriptional regulator with XRE-family HTH domain